MSSSKITGLRPDLTLAQLVGGLASGVPIVLTLLAAFGVFDPTAAQQVALDNATQWAVGFSVLLIGGDAVIRLGRNLKDGKVEAAALTGPTPPPTPPRSVFGTTLLGTPIKGEVGEFVHEDEEASLHAEGLPSDEEEFETPVPGFARAGDVRPELDGES